jgi:hypothetical protein
VTSGLRRNDEDHEIQFAPEARRFALQRERGRKTGDAGPGHNDPHTVRLNTGFGPPARDA